MALSHSLFLFRLFVLRRGGAWNSQMRESHAVPWRLAATRLWPHTLAGLAIMAIVAAKTPAVRLSRPATRGRCLEPRRPAQRHTGNCAKDDPSLDRRRASH